MLSEVLRLLKPGWVACDWDDTCWWFPEKPTLVAKEGCWKGRGAVPLSDIFDIGPVQNWKKTLMEIK